MSFQFVPDAARHSSQATENQPANTSAKTTTRPKTSKNTMVWTEEHDKLLCREILDVHPFTGTKKGTVQRGAKWKQIVDYLMEIESPKFKIDPRAVRDRYSLLSQKLRKKLKEEDKESGIETDMTEVESALEEIIEKEDASEEIQENDSNAKAKGKEQERGTAEGMRKKAMERLRETQKRKGEEGDDDKKRKRRSNGNDAIVYLEERNQSRKEEMELKRKELELQEKKHDEFMKLMLQQQQQNTKQVQDFQLMMMNLMSRMGQK